MPILIRNHFIYLQTHLQSKIQCNRNEKAISDPRAQLVYGVIYTDATMFGCSQQGQLLTCSPGSLGISNRIIISQNARKTYEYLFQVIGKITENTLNCKIFILPNVPEWTLWTPYTPYPGRVSPPGVSHCTGRYIDMCRSLGYRCFWNFSVCTFGYVFGDFEHQSLFTW